MTFIQPKPFDSKIEVVENGGKTIIYLKSQKLKPRIILFFGTMCGFAFWFVLFRFMATDILNGARDWYSVLTFAFWVSGGIFLLRTLYGLIFSAKSEMIVLDSDSLSYQQGATFKFVDDKYSESRSYEFSESKKIRQFSKSQIGGINAENRDGKQFLAIYYGTEKIEIGEDLTEDEHEWLHNVLRSWKGF